MHRKRRNPFGFDLSTLAILGAMFYFGSKLLPKSTGPQDSGAQIRSIDYFAWVLPGADQDFHVFINHKGAGGLFKVRVALTTGTSAIPAAFGIHGDAAWEQFLYVSLPDDGEWTAYDYHVTGKMNVDGLHTYNIYTSIADPAGKVITENWRNGAVYVA